MGGPENSSAFSVLAPARAKFLLVGPPAPLPAAWEDQVRSFSIEHVSPASLVQQEISRRTALGQSAVAALLRGSAAPDHLHLAAVRKWFWARKPDAGFLLQGFPATLLQALVFDEWLETRGETLTAVFAPGPAAAGPVARHYRTQGLPPGVCRAAA